MYSHRILYFPLLKPFITVYCDGLLKFFFPKTINSLKTDTVATVFVPCKTIPGV